MNRIPFDPNGVSRPNGCFFGFPDSGEEAKIVFLPVPWDVTTSYGIGTADGPQAILEASLQVDLYDFDLPDAWQIPRGTIPIDARIRDRSATLQHQARSIVAHLEEGGEVSDLAIAAQLQIVNQASSVLNDWVYERARSLLEENKLVGLVGGDHSTPLGLMKALAQRHGEYGILQIDAHADLRQAFEGFTHSHASIMYNALQLSEMTHLVQVGIRDACEEERQLAISDSRVVMFDDWQLKANGYQGISWHQQCEAIVAALPEKVYISFDIDGLDPRFCPHTGTPVPGGLDFNQGIYLIQILARSGKTIIGFDLCEVAPGMNDEWDGNVGARLLYKLSNLMYLSGRSRSNKK
ncbi:agmatinase family protein [Oscillatoriales cyanobacterium LEGE 11467]|uniref:Agmatinase family protein n=1 Tax=Zarconia navalis LEGE 11467 TaxID=1828826 RepID=A0A928Z9I8_9CYAN|nr:agmatinase family protein [Zarconia navalis]MBE9040811.1 agmatinase family protein [Zarconia navalis LEGE 11467]